MEGGVNIKNKRAKYEFEFLDTYIAGIVLKGTEIKSIRKGEVSLKEGFCHFQKGELWLKNATIAEYAFGNQNNHDPKRDRKLLLSKQELGKLQKKSKDVGLSIIPYRLFISDRGFAKLEIALARGKKLHDKRQSIKDKDVKRDLQRKNY